MKFAGVFFCLALMCSTSNSEIVHVEEITVSSGAFATSQPMVTILSEQDLVSKKSQTLADLLRDVTGVDVARSGGSGQPSSVFIRGAKGEHTLVLIDGIEANDPTTTTRFFDFSSLNVENIERIEIYRGANSVRFGADAIGGVINIITKKGAGADQGEVSVELGSYESRRLSASNSGELAQLNYSAAVSLFSTYGFSAAEAGPADEPDGVHRTTASLRLGWRFETRDDLSYTLRVNQTATDLDVSGGVGGDDPNYEAKSRQILSGLTFQTTRLIANLRSVFGAYVGLAKRDYLNSPNPGSVTEYRENFQSENLKFETRQIYRAGESSRLEALIQFRGEQGGSDQVFNGSATKLTARDQSVVGVALLYDTLVSNFKLVAGGRHDRFAPIGESISSSSISLGYDIEATGTLLQASYGTGFKNPSLFQLYSSFGSPNLRPEQSTTVDASIEQKLAASFTGRLSYFQNTYSNLIDFDISASKYSNIAAAKSDGAELEFSLTPVRDLRLNVAAKVLTARDDVTGLELLRRPRWSHSANIEWKNDIWFSSVTYRFSGDRDDLDPVSFQRLRLPSFATLDAVLRYQPAHAWGFSLRLENMANVSYQEVAGYRTSGRAIFISASRPWSRTD